MSAPFTVVATDGTVLHTKDAYSWSEARRLADHALNAGAKEAFINRDLMHHT